MKKGNIVLVCNSDIGKHGTLGFRVERILNILNKNYNFKVYARNNTDSKFKKRIYCNSINSILNKIATAFYKFISINLPAKKINDYFFNIFVFKNIKKSKIIHSWENSKKFIKKVQNLDSIIIFDVSIVARKNNDLEKWFSNKLIDYFIVPSEFSKKELIKYYSIPSHKFFIIPFGVDINKYKPISKIKKKEGIIFIFSGSLASRKGILCLLNSWDHLNLSDAKLVICGRSHVTTRKQIKKYKKNKTITFKGHLNEENLIKEYQKADVFVFPSLREGSAKATYEAMACGLPIITTPNAGSVARDKKDGFIIMPKSVKEIKEKILYFYNNPKEIEKMGKNARKRAEKFTWERYGKNVVDVYEKVLKR